MLRFVFATLMLAILSTLPSFGHAVENGTRAIVSDLSYWGVITRLEAAIKRQKLKIISRASVRGTERQKKLGIPGNMVIGAFDDEYTTRILRANVAAGIEAPIRFYITRHPDDKTTTLWYRRPSWVLAPYSDKTGELRAVGEELDKIMETIAAEATGTTGSKKPANRGMVKRETRTPKVKPRAKAPAAKKPTIASKAKARAPERVAKATPRHPAGPAKPVAKRTTPAPNKTAKAVAAVPPKPLIPKKPDKPVTGAAPKRPAPVALKAPKALTPAKAKTKGAGTEPQQRAKVPIETARRSSSEGTRRRTPPTAKRDPDRDAISLTPLMLKLQGQ
jgi:uncharacterized protein (DUF302 family)